MWEIEEIKRLDFVRTENGSVGLVTDKSGEESCIALIVDKDNGKSAWYEDSELTKLDSLPRILRETMSSQGFYTGEE